MNWLRAIIAFWENLTLRPAMAIACVLLAGLAIALLVHPWATSKSRTIAELADSNGTLSVSDTGSLVLPQKVTLSPLWQKRVADMLVSGHAVPLPDLAENLKTVQSALALLSAPAEAGARPALISPVATAVRTLQPQFRWRAVAGVTGYRLVLVRQGQQTGAVNTGPETNLVWSPKQAPLQRGEVYTWQVEAELNGELRLSQPASFFVLTTAQLKDLEQIERESAGSAAILTAVYQAFGLYEEASREWNELRRLNPANDAVTRIGESLSVRHANE